jgi:hypothetical protein
MSSGDGFVAKLNPAGSALVFSTYLGGTDDESCLCRRAASKSLCGEIIELYCSKNR